MENAVYLFAAFGVIWALLFGYVILLSKKQQQLKREIDLMNEVLRERNEKQ